MPKDTKDTKEDRDAKEAEAAAAEGSHLNTSPENDNPQPPGSNAELPEVTAIEVETGETVDER